MPRKSKPWYRKDRGFWVATIDGKRYNLGPNKATAEQKFHALMVNPGDNESITVFEVMDEFLDWTKKHRAIDTFHWYQKRLQRFVDECKNTACLKFKPLHVQRWLDQKESWGPTYKAGMVTAFKRCFNWAVRQGYVKSNPVQFLEKPTARRRETPVTRKEYNVVLKNVNKRDPFYDLIVFSWESGCRPQESLRFSADDVMVNKKRIIIENPKDRGPKWRVIHLNSKALRIVKKHIKLQPQGPVFRNTTSQPWTPNSCSNRFNRLKKKVGRTISLYDFRHAYGTELLKAGVDPVTVAELMGHTDLKMLMEIYQHLGQDQKYIDKELSKKK